MLGRNGIRGLSASILALLLSLSPVDTAQAQGAATVTGRVQTEAGQPLYGANVTIEALAMSVGTDEEGRYTINIPGARVSGQQVVLRVRSFGYVPQVKSVTLSAGSQTHDFSLVQDVNRLSQVVVTGVTGETQIKMLPFTVAQVTAEDMPVPGANPLAQLQGKVPGANIVSSSGRPGSAPAIILRGPQSINAEGRGQEPLYIIDGVISQGGIQDINPQDIATVEVVKGAAASSLYGSRAGNGVIQITTRSGKNVGEGVRFRSQVEYGTADIENEYRYPKSHMMMMNKDYTRYCVTVGTNPACARDVDFAEEAFRINDGGDLFALDPVLFTNDYGISSNPGASARWLYMVNPWLQTYNPIQQVVTNGETINATVDATGRVGRTNFFTSANQYRQEGAVRFMQGYTRNALRLNLDQQLASSWNFSVRSSYTNATDYNSGFDWFSVTRSPAGVTQLERDSKDRIYIRTNPQSQGDQNNNPMYIAENFTPVNRISRFLGQATVRWQPLLWLDGEATFGYDTRSNHFERIQDRGWRTTTGPFDASTHNGDVRRSSSVGSSLNASLDLTARKNWFEENLSSRLTFRTLFEAQDDRGLDVRGEELVVSGLNDIGSTNSETRTGGSFIQQVRQIGMFMNLDLDWQGKYIVSGLVRRDGASLFGENHRWQTYGRGSVAWRMSEESWFGIDQISEFKFRASVGQAGNRPRFDAQYETFDIAANGQSLSPEQIGNKALRPEVSTETEVGFDAEFLSRYALSVTHAHNVIDQQIMPVTPPAIAGFASQWQNVGELTNNTIEVSLNVPVIQTRDLNYSVRLIFDRTKSVISRLDVPRFFADMDGTGGAGTMFPIVEGGVMGQISGRRFMEACSDLPDGYVALTCGGAGSDFQVNDDGFLVYVGAGNSLGDGITKNLWMTKLGAADAPYGGGNAEESIGWGLPILMRDATGAVAQLPLGHALPNFRYAISQQASWKNFSAFVLVDATIGKSVWNQARAWSTGDFMTEDSDQAGKSVQLAKPIGYYFRAVSTGGVGGLYDVLGPNNRSVENASFVKVREVSLGYRLGELAGIGDWSLTLIGRNLLTFSDYKGFDPEVGAGGGSLNSGVLNSIDSFGFPNLRTISFQIGTSF